MKVEHIASIVVRPTAHVKSEYIRLIVEHDRTLALLRKHLLECTPAHKHEWWERINSALDERLRLMKLRDLCADKP